MAQKTYNIIAGGMHERFLASRAKVQIIGGGYGNGKTAASCIKGLQFANEYPGSNGLIARATYPKLNDTIRKEFLAWCPKAWIKRLPVKDDNTLILTNGSSINFRYVAQRGVNTEETKSNLLSATYDWIIVDQLEDPEFSHKDFMDLMGRLRGTTEYTGDDPTMPKLGPQMFIATLNPNRNWTYRELVKPLHEFQRGRVTASLLVDVDNDGKPVLDDNLMPKPIIELFEGTTYENVHNVGDSYIRGMLATFTNASMRDRFIFGKWGALEGLVYPQFDPMVHLLTAELIDNYIANLVEAGYDIDWSEGYDHGIQVPACYLLSLTDPFGNVIVVDGFYHANQQINDLADDIKLIRLKHGVPADVPMFADPSLFRRHTQGGKIGTTVAAMFAEEGIVMQRGANNITAGIAKMGQYLTPMSRHEHPTTELAPAPYLYFCSGLSFIEVEISDYYIKRDAAGISAEKPLDRNDHAMDTIKYILTRKPALQPVRVALHTKPSWMTWQDAMSTGVNTLPRHK